MEPETPEQHDPPALKHCHLCGKDKPLEEFFKNKKAKDGHQRYCKACWPAYIKPHQDRYESKNMRVTAYVGKWKVRPRIERIGPKQKRRTPQEMEADRARERSNAENQAAEGPSAGEARPEGGRDAAGSDRAGQPS